MNRRTLLKRLFTTVGFSILLPKSLLALGNQKKKIHFVGLGGAGCNILEHFLKKKIKAKFTGLCTDDRKTFEEGVPYLSIPYPEMNPNFYISINDNIEKKLEAFNNVPFSISKEVKNTFNDDSHYVLLVGLGGFTGSRLLTLIIELLVQNKKKFSVISGTPFKYEGRFRNTVSKKIVARHILLPGFYPISLESMREKYGNLSFIEAFKNIDEEFYRTWEKINTEI